MTKYINLETGDELATKKTKLTFKDIIAAFPNTPIVFEDGVAAIETNEEDITAKITVLKAKLK